MRNYASFKDPGARFVEVYCDCPRVGDAARGGDRFVAKVCAVRGGSELFLAARFEHPDGRFPDDKATFELHERPRLEYHLDPATGTYVEVEIPGTAWRGLRDSGWQVGGPPHPGYKPMPEAVDAYCLGHLGTVEVTRTAVVAAIAEFKRPPNGNKRVRVTVHHHPA